MKFIWNEPEKNPDSRYNYPNNIYWTDAIIGWLRSQQVWLGERKYNVPVWEISYNYAYHFYNIYVFDQKGNPNARVDFRKYLQSTELDWTEGDTYRWLPDHTQCQGTRFWIQSEDFPNEIRFNDRKVGIKTV